MCIDIIIPTYHRYALLAEALESVRKQTYPHWECWVAEDGESERTRTTVAPFLRDKRFHYLPGPHTGTPAGPRNRALHAGKNRFVAFLDDDDIWLPEKLAQQIAYLSEHSRCVLLASNALILEGNKDYRAERERLPLYFQKAPFGRVSYEKLVQDDWFINSAAVIRRWALKYAGVQNETLHKGPDGEDYDLWLRIGALGEMWLMPEPLMIYREMPSKHQGPESAGERRRNAYHTKYNIYRSAMQGVGEMPSPLLFPENARQERLCRSEMAFYAAGPRFLGRLRHRIGSRMAGLLYRPPSKKKQRQKALRAFAECKARWKDTQRRCTAACIIFSKDRTLQLHGLLSTFREKVFPAVPVHVLYRTSSAPHQEGYAQLEHMFADRDVCFHRQADDGSFKQDLMEILCALTSDMVFFLVDDILFTESVDIRDILRFDPDEFIPSLRMGLNLERSYVLQSVQPRPNFSAHSVGGGDSDKIVWKWEEGDLDWGYPLSVDGHFFARREMAAMAALLSFKAPNSFEDQLQMFRPYFTGRHGVAYRKSKIVNIPCNRVQNEITNLSGNIHPDTLLRKWQQGYQIDYEKLYGTINESAHQEFTLPLIPRPSHAKLQ